MPFGILCNSNVGHFAVRMSDQHRPNPPARVLRFSSSIASGFALGRPRLEELDHTRKAVLKGLPTRAVICLHVLRNGLVPTIAVIATQIGYLLGGLVAIEILFNYNGLGLLIWNAAKAKDFAMLQSAVLVIGAVYLLMSLAADILSAALNPRIRFGAAE